LQPNKQSELHGIYDARLIGAHPPLTAMLRDRTSSSRPISP
jgi:hypothetical protein